jgi:hypothetical protein
MPENLYRCIYRSKNLITGGPRQIATEIESILAKSRRNNARLGVTGALMFNRGVFAQVLEGECRAVETVFEKIQLDERHGDIQVLALDRVEQRIFGNWSMAFLGQSQNDNDLFGHIGRDTGFDNSKFDGERLLDIVRTLAFEDEARAA